MKPRLIIIDDHPIVARGAADLLSPLLGAECTCAHSGQEALSLVKPKSVIRLLCANKLSFCHLPFRFSVAMEPHCTLKT